MEPWFSSALGGGTWALYYDADSGTVWPTNTILTDLMPNNTTTFHVVDAAGNAAAVTTSLGAQFLIAGDSAKRLLVSCPGDRA